MPILFFCCLSDVRLEAVIVFSIWPRFQITTHNITGASIEQLTAEFDGFADATKDTQISQNLSQGTPAWVSNNLALINSDLAKIFVGFTNQRLSPFFTLSNIIYGMITYDPAVPCSAS